MLLVIQCGQLDFNGAQEPANPWLNLRSDV